MKAQVWTVPNGLSALRLLLVPTAAVVLIRGGNDTLAIAMLVLAGVTDWLDGFLARKLNQISDLGTLLDPLADRLAVICFAVALTYRGAFTWYAVGAVVLRDVMLLATLPALRRAGRWALPVTMTGKTATAVLFTALPLGLIGITAGAQPVVSTLAESLLWAGAAIYWWAGLHYVRTVRRMDLTNAKRHDS